MRMKLRLTASAALTFFATALGARPFTARDLASIERVSSPSISTDGRYVAYALRTTDWDGNKGVNALNVIDLQGDTSKPLALLSGEKGSPISAWSADGRWLYFISGKSGSAQVWRSNPSGSVRQQLTAFPLDVSAFKLSPDQRTVFVAADVFPDCATLACTKERADAKAKEKGSAIEIKSGPSRFFDTYLTENHTGLFAVDVTRPGAPADAPPIVRGFEQDVGDGDSFTASGDGRTIYFASSDPATDPGSPKDFSRIYSVPVDGSAAPRAFIDQAAATLSNPVVSPDGRTLAYLANVAPIETYGTASVILRDLRTGRSRTLAPGIDIDFAHLVWSSDGRYLLATGNERGQSPLYRIDAVSGQLSKISADGVVSAFDSARGVSAFVRENLGSPGQLFVQQGAAAPVQLTHAGAAILANTPLSPSEQFSFTGWNGETVYGYITKPDGFIAGKTYPVAFLIHGGPHGNFGNAWSYRWNPQVWSGMGYAVVAIDFHGSSGYGAKFGQSIIGHWGDRPLEDLQKGWAYALSHYSYLDGNRACALGGSYGGYMVDWIASHWSDPWKCLVSHAGVFDVRSQAWVMDGSWFIDAQFGAVADIKDWERFNPAAYASQWKKPILVIHGGKDFRVPTEQGIAAYNAARRAGVPTKLVIFPDENHWVLKPQNSVQWYRNVEDWIDHYTGNTPPAAVAQAATAATK